MARTERSTAIARPAEEVFPYLLEEDKVPLWTTGLDGYERLDSGPLGRGARFRQQLEVSSQHLTIELEVTRYEPPHAAVTTGEVRGIDLISTYALAERDGGTRLTQTIEASGGGIKGRLLIPIIQPHLERKLDADLAKLRDLLAQS